LLGLRIESVELRHKQVLRGAVARAAGWTIVEVRRWGKYIVLELRRARNSRCLIIHLGMTGQLLLDGAPGRHTHALFGLEGGGTMLFNDIRRFGRLELAGGCRRLKGWGPIRWS
jgi:formamidopyrimidine-DNA glycosylase